MRLHRINAVIMRHLYLFPRTLERWAESIYWPVIDLVVWGLTSKWVETAGSSVPQLALILLTGVVFWQVVWRANYEISVNLLEEFWNQNMVNLFATPLSVWEWSVGLVVLGLIKNVLTLAIGAGAVWVLYRLNIFGRRSPVGAPGGGAGGPFYGAQPLQPAQTRAPTGECLP